MSTSRLVRSLVVAAGICVLAGAGPDGRIRGQQQPAPQPPPEPTFRTDASFVLTDVFVTADGTPVTDLTQADFEVKEDGVVQTIRSFEAILHTPQPVGLPRRNPSTVAESNAMIADPRRRVFVVFLDTYHVDRADSMVVRKALQDFLKTALGPDDLIAYMTPHMSGRDISFSSSTEPLIRYFEDNPVWGLGDESPGTETDEVERNLQTCFIGNDAAWIPLRSRLREQKAIESLGGLVSHLDGLRESRKAVIAVTLGWRLFRENETRMTDKDTTGTRRRRGAARRRPGRQAGLSGSQPRRRVERSNLRQRPHAGFVREQPPDVHGSDRPGEPGEHELLHRRCGRPAHRDASTHGHRPRSHGRGPQPGARTVFDPTRFDPHPR